MVYHEMLFQDEKITNGYFVFQIDEQREFEIMRIEPNLYRLFMNQDDICDINSFRMANEIARGIRENPDANWDCFTKIAKRFNEKKLLKSGLKILKQQININ